MNKTTSKLLGFVKDSSDTIWQIGNDVYRVTSKAGELDSKGLPSARRWESNLEHFMLYAKRGAFLYIQLL